MSSVIDRDAGTTANEFRMPSLGADMRFGTLVAWLVKPGDRVKRGDVVAEVETEKGVFEVEISNGGIVDEVIVAKGTKVPVGTVLARLRTDGAEKPQVTAATPSPVTPPTPSPVAAATPSAVAPEAAPSAPPAPPEHAPRASPLARKIAQTMGVDLAQVAGTGPEGAITKADVERAASAAGVERVAPIAAPSEPAATESMLAMRRAVAAAVSRSKREIPHYYLSTDINLGPALKWLAAKNEKRPVVERVLPAVLLLKSVAVALRQYPALNGFWTDDAHHAADAIHVGIAISLRGGGLIAPAIHDTDRLSLDDLMRALSDLVRRARSSGLRSSEMTDATITVSNLGDEGASSVLGVIYPPQLALVGFGKISERPWAENGMLGVRPVVTATLAADHRATDGHYGGRFLAEVDRLLQTPESL